MFYHGQECIIDTPLETSFTFLSFLLLTHFGALQQLPVNCRNVKCSSAHEKHKISKTSLYDAALSEKENAFQYTYMAFMFHHIKTTEESNTQDECIQSQHYINFKKEEGITENCKLYSTKLTATDLTQENIKAAEVLFNYKFKLFNTNDGERNKADMGAFFRNFSNIQIRNNKELFIFLSETLNWGQNIPFNNDIKFGTNLKIYSNFVSQTSALLGSCIEGNHRLYTAL